MFLKSTVNPNIHCAGAFLKTNVNFVVDKRSKPFPLMIILKIHLTLSLDDIWILLEEN